MNVPPTISDCPSSAGNSGGLLTSAGGNGSIATAIFSEVLGVGRPMSDDCLTLNIWTKPQTGESSKAVLLWIYGGAFFMGNTAAKLYNGARLASENDVIVVSANYRTNIFGFPGAPGLKNQNVGLLDQRRAVEWVRDNIASFGGDPKRITLFGESAGGASTDTYAYTWPQEPIVHGIIAQSGTVSLVPWIGGTGPGAWFSVSQKLGCGGQEAGEKTVDCMRSKGTMEIVNSMGASANPLAGGFGPVPDGQSYFSDAQVRAKAGNFAKIVRFLAAPINYLLPDAPPLPNHPPQ
jgi:cholinesterase